MSFSDNQVIVHSFAEAIGLPFTTAMPSAHALAFENCHLLEIVPRYLFFYIIQLPISC